MRFQSFLPTRFLLLAVLPLSTLLLSACSKDKDKDSDPQPAASTGEMKYTYLGTTYTITAATEATALYEVGTHRLFLYASPTDKPGLAIVLDNVTPGNSTRTFLKSSPTDDRPSVATLLRYDVPGTTKPSFNTLNGPSASNGQMTITGYDLSNGRISGTFSFTGGPIYGTNATGTAVVTNGSFSFTTITQL